MSDRGRPWFPATLADHLYELFQLLDPTCVLDVGANTGQYARELRSTGYEGWIVSFEPIPDVFGSLAAAAADDPRWLALQLAVGATAETRDLHVAADSRLSSFFSRSDFSVSAFGGGGDVVATENVEVTTLAEWWRSQRGTIPLDRVFLKTDTQGFDLEVLEGCGELVRELLGLQFEASLIALYDETPGYLEMLTWAHRHGFDLTGAFPIFRDSLLRIAEMDCVMVNGAHRGAAQWEPRWQREWSQRVERLIDDVSAAVPAASSVAVADSGQLALEPFDGRSVLPFLEAGGDYWGDPPDAEEAVAGVERLAAAGVSYFALAWPAFWMLYEYPDFARFLGERFAEVARSEAVVVFRLEAPS